MTEFEMWLMKNQSTNHKCPLQKDQLGYYHHPETRMAYLAYLLGKENKK